MPAKREMMRFAGLLATLAASLLVVSSAWLVNFPTRHVTVVSPATVTLPAWERSAITLQAEPTATDGMNSAVADAGAVDWMLTQLPHD